VDSKLPDDDSSRSLPASLNPAAIKILREEMKFDGMIVSDCLEMDGVRATYGTEKSAIMALKVSWIPFYFFPPLIAFQGRNRLCDDLPHHICASRCH
jgi:hypothetical protein